MARSLKKWFYVNPKILKKIAKMEAEGSKRPIKLWDRACQIVPDMVWYSFAVHNGKQFVTVYVTDEMIWHRFGEFSPTKQFRGHPF